MANPELNLLVLKTSRLEELCAFYKALGIDLKEEKHGRGPTHYSGQLGSTLLELYSGNKEVLSNDVRLGFTVPDLERTLAELSKQGSKVVSPPRSTPWGTQATVLDPDGRFIDLTARE